MIQKEQTGIEFAGKCGTRPAHFAGYGLINDFNNQQIRKTAPQIIELGERRLDIIEEKFEKICFDIEEAIALQYLLNQNGTVKRFGLLGCLDQMIEQLQEYAAQADEDDVGRVFLLEKLFSTLAKEAQK